MHANGLYIILDCVLYGVYCLSFLVLLCVSYSNGLSGILYCIWDSLYLYCMARYCWHVCIARIALYCMEWGCIILHISCVALQFVSWYV